MYGFLAKHKKILYSDLQCQNRKYTRSGARALLGTAPRCDEQHLPPKDSGDILDEEKARTVVRSVKILMLKKSVKHFEGMSKVSNAFHRLMIA